jgi:peroxiredoxin
MYTANQATRGRSSFAQEVDQVGRISGVGREAPKFALTACDGNEISLGTYRGDWLPVLVFLPASSPGLADKLRSLSGVADQLWGFRGQLIGLSDASEDALRGAAAEAGGVAFPLLGHAESVAKAYGAWGERLGLSTSAYVVDKAGKIAWVGDGDEETKPGALVAALQDVAR